MVPVVNALLSMGSAGGLEQPPVQPHDTDWIIPAGIVLAALSAIACIMALIVRCTRRCCKERTAEGVSMFDHECVVASLAMVLLLVVSLASLYYLFCFRGGCFGGAVLASGPAPAIAGRKAKMMMSLQSI